MSDSLDARCLSPAAQEALRRRAVRAVREEGMSKSEAARTFGVSRTSIHAWLDKFNVRGVLGLASRTRGRPKRSRLAGHQAATTVRLIADRCPDQLKMPFALWTREAVAQLIADRYDIQVSVWTAGRYLRKWGFTPQKPLRRAYERNPVAVKKWLREEYPAIKRRAKREVGEILWGDEMGLRSDHQVDTSYGRKGQTPVILGTGQRFRCNMISAISNQGRLAFMVFKQRFTAQVMLDFLRRLIRHAGRKVFLVVDAHPVHKSKKVKRWLEQHASEIELFWLPGYSPELNPDEYLNQDMKSNALGRHRPGNQTEMIANLRSRLRSTQRKPHKVKNYFQHPDVKYAA
jgi:transposase